MSRMPSPAPVDLSETYATLIHYPEVRPSVCQAAVLGTALRRLDPKRQRVVVASSKALAISKQVLEQDGLWRVLDRRELAANDSRTSQSRDTKAKLAHESGRKLPLFRLPYKRVLYLDADILPVRSLRHVWDRSSAGTLSATLNVPTEAFDKRFGGRCFNGGVLLVEPSKRSADRLQAAILDQWQNRKFNFWNCPQGRDQPALNAAFSDWRALPLSVVLPVAGLRYVPSAVAQMSLRVQGDGVTALSEVPKRKVRDFLSSSDVYHAWGSTDPISLMRMGKCTRRSVLEAPPHSTDACEIVRSDIHEPIASAVHSEYAKWWWHFFGTLPNSTQQYCLPSKNQGTAGGTLRPGLYLRRFFHAGPNAPRRVPISPRRVFPRGFPGASARPNPAPARAPIVGTLQVQG